LIIALILSTRMRRSPRQGIQQAQGAIDAARAAAPISTPTEFTAAQEALRQATKPSNSRDYRLALNTRSTAASAPKRREAAADGKPWRALTRTAP